METLDETKLKAFMEKALGDLGASASMVMALIGDQLGLYKAMAKEGAMTPSELAKKTGTAERYIREWLCNQAAGGYVAYDPSTGKYALPPEHALALAHEESPVFLGGAFQVLAAMYFDQPKIAANFKTGEGMDWGDHDHRLFEGTERFFRPSYRGNLLSSWIPALEGVEEKLKNGGQIADVGCGLGTSTILMAQAFPNSKFFGFDYHRPSIEAARERAKKAGVEARITFEVAKSTEYPGKNYDLVAHFDCLHDMGDPVSAGRHVLQSLKPDGTWMIVEPFAGDKVEDNLNPVGRLFYAASTCVCVPASLAQNGIALGAQAGEARLKSIITEAGFKNFRRAAETPFNLILEAKP
ncbi:MAG: methyltransferase domain-containing protein [bacterium]